MDPLDNLSFHNQKPTLFFTFPKNQRPASNPHPGALKAAQELDRWARFADSEAFEVQAATI